MFLPKGTKVRDMGVVDQYFRGIGHPVAMLKPPLTELSIFSCGERKSGIKTVNGAKEVCRHSQIIRGQEMCIIRIGVVALIEVIDEELGSR
jgi:hypothetical protein